MKIEDAIKLINDSAGKHIDKIYLPSLGKEIFFNPLSTSDVKTLTRMSLLDEFDINVEVLKLSLFDKLLGEDLSIYNTENNSETLCAKTITQLDYLSFLIGIRNMLDNNITYNFTCHREHCKETFPYTINLADFFDDLIYKFKPQHEYYETSDNNGLIWKFELTNFSMYDYLYFRYFVEELGTIDETSPDVIYERKFIKPVLYIKNIYINDELLEDWNNQSIPKKLAFWNKLPPELTINTLSSNDNTVYSFIQQTFFEEELEKIIDEITVKCPKCGHEWRGLFRFDNFFMF